MTITAICAAFAATAASIYGLWRAHIRAVITAEQRGRLDEAAKANAVNEAVRLTRAQAIRTLEEAARLGEDAARATPQDAVDRAALRAWLTNPPGDKQ
jgi:hypothetical protein